MSNEDESSDGVAASLMEISVTMEPLVEAARGMRIQMVGEGWSDHEAEKTAGEWLRGMIRMSFVPSRGQA